MHGILSLPAVTIFVGSMLLFGLQPLLGRTLLPSFGGTAAVWTVCLAAYQTLLLAGYFYAHAIRRRPLRSQRRAHLALLGLAVLWAAAFARLRPLLARWIGNSGAPALEVLLCVLVFIGLPYVLLSANSTLVQSWLARDGQRDRGVYRLYAVSNLGSFAGLLLYPFVLEPYLSLSTQWWGFTACLGGYALLLHAMSRGMSAESGMDVGTQAALSAKSPCPKAAGASALWFILPAVSVFVLNAVTAHLTLDVMPLPLLWVLLLGMFLLSYVVGFSGFAERWLTLWAILTVALATLAGWFSEQGGSVPLFAINLAAGAGLCLAGGIFLHGFLYRLRPEPALLTRFYLYGAAGGAAGGIAASLLAPLLFTRVTEYPLAIGLLVALAACFALGEWRRLERRRASGVCLALVLAALALLSLRLFQSADTKGRRILDRRRGFYGVVTVTEMPAAAAGAEGVVREFVHGGTVHGMQALIPGRERMPTTYFTETGGGFAVLNHPRYRRGQPMRVGLVGAGIGVMLSYCRTNDVYVCYEISPEVAAVARDPALFTFDSGAPGRVEWVMGDARKALEAEAAAGAPRFDVLVLDAFTGDNQPYHVFTREAFALYFERLQPDGILTVNISNWHMDLMPFAKSVSGAFDVAVLGMAGRKDFARLAFSSTFAVYARRPGEISIPPGVRLVDFKSIPDVPMPTDEKGSFNRFITW